MSQKNNTAKGEKGEIMIIKPNYKMMWKIEKCKNKKLKEENKELKEEREEFEDKWLLKFELSKEL
tara:strand:+ start:269 stop:463 length:195 start_codon:yes stop_codon:yes gene_type:complete